MSIIEKGSLILVTGVSGYIASHTALQLLEAGYNVRGTVRSEDKAKWLYELFDKKFGKGRFETVIVKDFGADGAFDQAVKGVVGICHMASDMTFSDKADDVVPAVVRGATSIVHSASKESGIKSFVYTSSSSAALIPKPNKVIKIQKDTWDDEAVENAYKPGIDGFTVYAASKTKAERAVWKTVKDCNVSWQVAAVLPNFNVGPIIKPGGENSSSTASMALRLFNGDESAFDGFPPQYHVDVRDAARLHVIALTDPEANGERLFAFGDPFNRTDLLRIFQKLFPDRKFPAEREEGKDLSQIPTEDAEALLKKHYGKGFSSLEESLEAVTAGYK